MIFIEYPVYYATQGNTCEGFLLKCLRLELQSLRKRNDDEMVFSDWIIFAY